MITAVRAWLAQWSRWITAGGLLALLVGTNVWSWQTSESLVRAQWAAADADRDRIAARDALRRTEASVQIAARHARQQAQTDALAHLINREVPTYVPATDCPLSGGFRVLHDASAAAAVPDPARIADAAPVPAADAAATVAPNNIAHNACADQVEGLQAWIRAQIGVSR